MIYIKQSIKQKVFKFIYGKFSKNLMLETFF